MDVTSPDNRGWATVKEAAEYARVSERTFRKWLKNGLRHSRIGKGMIRVHYSRVDEYLFSLEVKKKEVDAIVDAVMEEF